MRTAKVLIAVFLVTLFAYVTAFTWIEHTRVRQGPWLLTFTTETNTPALVINQPFFHLTNIKILFPGATATNAIETIPFAGVHRVPFDLPFGECIFLDTLSLPGTVTMKIFGHEIQLLPRVLTIDRKEQPWQPDAVISLPGKDSAEWEIKKLQGTWLLSYQQMNGTKLPDEVQAEKFHGKMVFIGHKINYSVELPGFAFTFVYKIHPDQQPDAIDLELTDTVHEQGVGQKFFGIYLLEGDALKICYNKNQRPTHFAAGAGSQNSLIVLKRKAPGA